MPWKNGAMPDTRSHRGAHPKDAEDFAPSRLTVLRAATADLSWLLTRGYPARRALDLVGDRFALRSRQRKAVGRCAASEADRRRRAVGRVGASEIAGRAVHIDGYNVLLTVEAALGGGVLLRGRDGLLRDMAAMSRHYKRVEETRRALDLLGEHLATFEPREVRWLFDRPISNSGRLRALMLSLAEERGWPWRVDLVANPDRPLKRTASDEDVIVATADSGILDAGVRWTNLAHEVVEASVDDPWLVDLEVELPLPPFLDPPDA